MRTMILAAALAAFPTFALADSASMRDAAIVCSNGYLERFAAVRGEPAETVVNGAFDACMPAWEKLADVAAKEDGRDGSDLGSLAYRRTFMAAVQDAYMRHARPAVLSLRSRQ